MTNNIPIFGRRLKTLRELRGITQKELADNVDISISNVQKLETGVKLEPPGGRVIAQIAVYLQGSVDYLLGLKDEIA